MIAAFMVGLAMMMPAADGGIREPAVAGLFYPRDKAELSRTVDRLLAQAEAESVPDVRALIVPHAGYQFSGRTAAIGYKTVAGRDIRTVILLMPSHYAAFQGAFVTDRSVYRTPLGDVPIGSLARTLAKKPPFTSQPNARVRRPDWWRESSASPPPAGADTPETWEHSGEVQLPFLQKVLGNFELVPVVFGSVDPAEVARVLAEHLEDRTLVIASSDLSHYRSYAEARAMDQRCIRDILSLKTELEPEAACGAGPILTVVHLARLKGWTARLLDYRNSGDATGDIHRPVVGYASIVFGRPQPATIAPADRNALLALARRTIEAVVAGRQPPQPDPSLAKFREPTGCFVTLTKGGRLRGCIGHILPQEPLPQAVVDNAISAALRDSRFPPVQSNEVAELQIEISVLTVPQPLEFRSPEELLAKLQPHRDGVVLQVDGRSATYLPQVWAQIPDKVQFLNSLAQKAGAPPDAWRRPGTKVLIYHVESFHEGETCNPL